MNLFKSMCTTIALLGVCVGAIAGESCNPVYSSSHRPGSTSSDYTCGKVLNPESFKNASGKNLLPDGASNSAMYAALKTADNVCGSGRSIWAFGVDNCCNAPKDARGEDAGPAELHGAGCAAAYAQLQLVVNASQ